MFDRLLTGPAIASLAASAFILSRAAVALLHSTG